MRVFVALFPPADAVAELDTTVAAQRPGWPQLRWVQPERWHLTLAFLGDVADSLLPQVTTQLAAVARAQTGLRLALAGAGAFPDAATARVLWAGVHGDTARMAALADAVKVGAGAAGAGETDTASSHPHLTLARCRTRSDIRPLCAALAEFRGLAWRADEFHLIRSHLAPSASYETLETFPFSIASPWTQPEISAGESPGTEEVR